MIDETMQLIVGWTIVGAFVFTVIITCLSLIGWVRFADARQQNKLFTTLIVQIVLGVGTSGLGLSRYDPAPVRDELIEKGKGEGIDQGINMEIVRQLELAPQVGLTKEQVASLVEGLRVDRFPELKPVKQELQTRIRALPAGRIKQEDAVELRKVIPKATLRVSPR